MATVSSAVRGIAESNKLVQEAMRQGIASYGALAERLKEAVENETGKKVKESAIVMALRRHSENLSKKDARERIKLGSEIIMKTGLAYLSFAKIPNFLERLEEFYRKLNHERDTLNIIHGNYEISVITNEKHRKKIKELLGKESLKSEESGLVSISLTLGKDFAYTPGILFEVTRKLYWSGINIFELITTATEMTFLFQQKDAIKAYGAIQELVKEK